MEPYISRWMPLSYSSYPCFTEENINWQKIHLLLAFLCLVVSGKCEVHCATFCLNSYVQTTSWMANPVTFVEYSHMVCLDTGAEKDCSFSEVRDSWMRQRSWKTTAINCFFFILPVETEQIYSFGKQPENHVCSVSEDWCGCPRGGSAPIFTRSDDQMFRTTVRVLWWRIWWILRVSQISYSRSVQDLLVQQFQKDRVAWHKQLIQILCFLAFQSTWISCLLIGLFIGQPLKGHGHCRWHFTHSRWWHMEGFMIILPK